MDALRKRESQSTMLPSSAGLRRSPMFYKQSLKEQMRHMQLRRHVLEDEPKSIGVETTRTTRPFTSTRVAQHVAKIEQQAQPVQPAKPAQRVRTTPAAKPNPAEPPAQPVQPKQPIRLTLLAQPVEPPAEPKPPAPSVECQELMQPEQPPLHVPPAELKEDAEEVSELQSHNIELERFEEVPQLEAHAFEFHAHPKQEVKEVPELQMQNVEIQRLRKDLGERSRELEILRAEKSKQEAEKGSELQAHNADIELLRRDLCERDRILLNIEIERLQKDLCERNRELEILRAAKSGDNDEIEQLRKDLCERDRELKILRAEKSGELESLGVQLAQREHNCTMLRARLKSFEQDIRIAVNDQAEQPENVVFTMAPTAANLPKEANIRALDEASVASTCASRGHVSAASSSENDSPRDAEDVLPGHGSQVLKSARAALSLCDTTLSKATATLSQKDSKACLQADLHSKTWELKRLESQQEKQLEDAEKFVKRLAESSSQPMMAKSFKLDTLKILGQGNYGFVVCCVAASSGDRFAVKLQGERWAGPAMREWSHGSQCSHPNIVRYTDAFLHRDTRMEVEYALKAAFKSGALVGREPRAFPARYFCCRLEYMDQGNLQSLVQRSALSAEGLGAVARSIASALAYMHKSKRTHNDVKPENVLLRTSPDGTQLIAKLADFGLAQHSIERVKDHDLFAYTIWCAGLGRTFGRCPGVGVARSTAMTQFFDAAPVDQSVDVWRAVASAVGGIWDGRVDVEDVERMSPLKGLVIFAPEGIQAPAGAERPAQKPLPIQPVLKRYSSSGRLHTPASDAQKSGAPRRSQSPKGSSTRAHSPRAGSPRPALQRNGSANAIPSRAEGSVPYSPPVLRGNPSGAQVPVAYLAAARRVLVGGDRYTVAA